MPSYLLPCSCGRRTSVSTAEAGQTIRCACGASLEVPTLRALGKLEPADVAGTASRGASAWNNRHRLAFVLVVAALGGLCTSAYLALQMPARNSEPSMEQVNEALRMSTPGETVEVYEDLKKGLDAQIPSLPPLQGHRTPLLWGLGIALGLSLLALAAAIVVLRTARKRN